jgi:hypothetical protein
LRVSRGGVAIVPPQRFVRGLYGVATIATIKVFENFAGDGSKMLDGSGQI